MAKRELQFDDGKSRKFWTIVLKGKSHTVTFGRIGTNGQTRTKKFDTQQEAQSSFDRLVGQKRSKGYADVKQEGTRSKRDVTGESPTPAEALRTKLRQHKRIAYIAETKRGDVHPKSSKIGGLPYLDTVDDWPVCGHCHKPLQFVLQLNLEEIGKLKGGPKGQGLFQVFYCTNPETYCDQEGDEPFSPFGEHVVARHYRPQSKRSVRLKNPPNAKFSKPVTIHRWQPHDDYPSSVETWYNIEEPELTDAEKWHWIDDPSDDPVTVDAEKLGGWPSFIQGPDYPDCPTCGNQMKLVFQLTLWDGRMAFLFRCPTHRKLAFSWQCG